VPNKSCSCWSINRHVTNSTRVGREPLQRNLNRSRVRFPLFCRPSEMFAQSTTEVIPRTRYVIETQQNMITILFAGRKRIALNISPKGRKFK
jgi:hypothetical protein